ncbi:nucleotide excision repair, TFIIH, subunit [Tilletiaria anomala UBC 951]|uniref:General transcription and DNA repair factor IIH subunit TFB5 n=1 Tax=Tilletiaria anomala (strain ATCC 24038 / CBS 436.72 / UBC 951) TaxID=1037660 RepID=A0A066V778_TILAU|nr:nucleotide excision repair, TFIIH, subunit [Tilletiaria anomala UBC 951]KDN37311.1 nucleotide excision repair, TFIIH, subunit [Tilletiaria anomala UBC 951]
MRAVKGTLLTCDPAVKQLILVINEQMVFVIEDLDETHLLIDPSMVEAMRIRLDDELEKNTYTLEV